MTAVVPLLAEATNLAITEHWHEVVQLHRTHVHGHDDVYSARIEALAVALHARLQEQGVLT